MDEKTTILCVSDASYLRRVRSLAASIAANFPGPTLHCHLINVSEEERPRILEKYPRCTFEFETRSFASDLAKRSYCANIRAQILLRLLDRGDSTLIYLDADSIVRTDLGELLKLIQQNDVVALSREELDSRLAKWATGVIGINNTDAGREFLEAWIHFLDKRLYEWFGDQISFTEAAALLGSDLRISSLPPRFIDWDYAETSPIWVGKGQRKFDEVYQGEERHYLNVFQELDP